MYSTPARIHGTDVVEKLLVLVLVRDAVMGALFRLLVRIAGREPVFPAADDTPAGAVGRLRPRMVIVDADHEAACSDVFYARVAEVGSKLLVFSSSPPSRLAEAVTARRGVPAFLLPGDRSAIVRTISEAV